MFAVLDDLANAARVKWIQLAQSNLSSSKAEYIRGIQAVDGRGNIRTISLVGWLPNAVEEGAEAVDLRETLLKNAPTSKEGRRYRAIPFQHGAPGGQGSTSTPMGARYGPQSAHSRAFGSSGVMDKGHASQLGRRVYRAAKQLQSGQRLKTSERGRRGFVQVPKLAPWHKTDIYSGMTKTPKASGQSQYMTFRTISDAHSTGWIHPGIRGRHLAEEVETHVQGLVAATINSAFASAMGGLK